MGQDQSDVGLGNHALVRHVLVHGHRCAQDQRIGAGFAQLFA
ncbi:hypothetical protein [Kocuria atrinae]|nr:hypothetical protein [Kocuria atrinae]